MSHPVHIIAEAGTNHGAKLDVAKSLVDAAADAGADSVKFQIIYPEGLYLPKFYKDGSYEPNEVFAMRAAGMLSDSDYQSLAEHCLAKGLPLCASVFDSRGIALFEEFSPPYFKIASCDLNNTGLLKEVAERGRKVVLSTGMASLGEVECAVEDVVSTGNRNLVLMHCVSIYPCPLERMNLNFLRVLQSAFGFPVGLSDHTEGSLASAIAVGIGVTWIEKHFTLDRSAEGFDHHYALEPAALAQFVQDVRHSWTACQPVERKVSEAEQETQVRARRGVYAARTIKPNEVIQESDLLVVRPVAFIDPPHVDRVVGRPARKTIHQYQAVSLESLEPSE